MQTTTLSAQSRMVLGKKVKKLRRDGWLPASVYGKEVKSQSLQVPLAEFLQVYRKAGETGLVELKFDGKSEHTLIANVTFQPLSRFPLHVEFHAVKLTEKIKANVPLELVGEAPAVANSVGIILSTLSEVEVEALPAELPDKIPVDVAGLSEVDQQITVGQLVVAKGVVILTPAEEIVAKVVAAVAEETKKELEAEEAAKAAEAAAAAPEGGAPTGEEAASAPQEKTPEAKQEEKKG